LRFIIFQFIFFISVSHFLLPGQCPYSNSESIIKKIDVSINANLDLKTKKAICTETIKWTNPSDVPITELRFYMYLNSFKSLETTFLKGSNGVIFGSDIKNRNADEWGSISVSNCKIAGQNDTLKWAYIQPDDGNEKDESVLVFYLPKPIMAGETISLNLNFIAKLPKFIARAGYSKDYFAFLHWFPQPGVFEKDKNGEWNWNCHQFFRSTEFYADFANYKVNITCPKNMVVAGTGCKVKEKPNGQNTKTVTFDARDVIDFAWIAYPRFEEYSDTWKGVEIKMYVPQEHCAMAPRYLGALKNALNFFEEKLGKYPYPTITLVDPPMHGLGSGFMEYPMLVTCASFHYVPQGIKTIESLAVHEFSHQYFMGILANNEKEEAWMDEGFVTFFEDEIVDHYFGKKTSIFNILGYKSGNKERSRLEYTSMDNLHDGPIARPGWLFNEGNFKEIIYAKTATVLQTLKGLVGDFKFYSALKHYYNKHKFSHPRENDFIEAMKEIIGDSIESMPVDTFFKHTLHGTEFCDYEIKNIGKSSFTILRNGGLILPLEIEVKYTDGSKDIFKSDGKKKEETIDIKSNKSISSVNIDPLHKIYLDINFNNNSKTVKKETLPAMNFGMKTMAWFQHILQTVSFFV
jgi:hypothetical protein